MPKFANLEATYDLKNPETQGKLVAGPNFICKWLHVDRSVYKEVYEPAEDTFTLIDAIHVDLSHELANLSDEAKSTRLNNVIEVG